MKPRRGGTPFRGSQVRYLLEGFVRWLAPEMQTADALRAALKDLLDDRELWLELELARADLPTMARPASTPPASLLVTAPIGAAVKRAWEHRCDSDDRLYLLAGTEEQCGKCGERRP